MSGTGTGAILSPESVIPASLPEYWPAPVGPARQLKTASLGRGAPVGRRARAGPGLPRLSPVAGALPARRAAVHSPAPRAPFNRRAIVPAGFDC